MSDLISKIRDYKDQVYGPYGNYLYVPMTEARSLYIPVTIGCSYGSCLFCDLNHGLDFKFLGLDLIEENLKKLSFIHSRGKRRVKKAVLVAGNPLVLETSLLVEIAGLIKKYFPDIKYISSFARADDILRKSKDELRILRDLGFDRISLGLESASNKVLKFQNKGLSAEENLEALRLLDELGISYSLYIMLGLGSKALSREHIEKTADFLNLVNPFEIIVVNLVLFKDAPLLDLVKSKEFKRLRPMDILREEYKLLKDLDPRDIIFNASHKTNHLALKGNLKYHKNQMLKALEEKMDKLESQDLSELEHYRWRDWSRE